MNGISRASILTLGTAMLWSGAGPAQNADAATSAAEAAPADAGVADIVVTAQRREERLQTVPIAISAFNQQDLRRGDVVDISRLSSITPGLTFGQSSLESRPAIRGVRTENVGANGDPTIGFYVDDIYQSRAVQAAQPFIDLARVEVQRGPQGTLYGRNTFGGNISVTTNLPAKDFDYGVNVVGGNYSRIGGDGFVNVPLGEVAGVRVAAYRERRDGYVRNTAGSTDLYEKDSSYVRATFRYAPTDDFEAVIRGNLWHEGGSGGQSFGYYQGGGLIDPNTGLRSLTGVPVTGIILNRLDGIADINGRDIGTPVSKSPYRFDGDYPSIGSLTQRAASASLRYQTGGIFVRSITGYQKFKYFSSYDGDALPIKTTAGAQTRRNRAFSQELQIGSTATTPFQWIAGLFYFNDKTFEIFESDLIPSAVTAFYGPSQAKTKSYAGFGQASYYVVPQVRLTAGGRYTSDDKEFFAANYNVVNNVRTLTSQGSFDRTFKKFTYRLGADFFAMPDNMIYSSFSTGFRSGGFNGAALTNPLIPATFTPENVKAYEIGTKNRSLDGRLQLNGAIYYNDFKALQVQNQFIINNTTLAAIRNAGKARAKGIELEAVIRPVPALTLNAAATFMNAKYTQYVTAAPAGYPGTLLSLAGKRIPYQPNHRFNLAARYDIDLGASGTVTPSVTSVISGDFYNTDFNTVIDRQKAYAKVDANLGWRSANGRFGAEAFVTNLTKRTVLIRGSFGGGSLLENFEPPRMYGLRISVRK